MPPVQTEVGVILGQRCLSGIVARECAKLYHEGRFKKIIVAGGQSVFSPLVLAGLVLVAPSREAIWTGALKDDFQFALKKGSTLEAEFIKQTLTERERVPEGDIIFCDGESRNTGENVENILGPLKGFSSAAFITLAPHARRIMETVRMQLDGADIALTTHSVYPLGLTRQNWQDHFLLRRGLSREAAKTDPANNNPHTSYHRRGFCEPVDIEKEIKRAKAAAPIPTPV